MNNTSKIRWITTTAIFIAMLVTLQSVTKPMGQYVTGSMVNMVLVMSTLTAGLASGVTVALLSPVFAFILGIGPAFVQLVPFVALGNLVLVLVWGIVCSKGLEIKNMAISLAAGAVAAFRLRRHSRVYSLQPTKPNQTPLWAFTEKADRPLPW